MCQPQNTAARKARLPTSVSSYHMAFELAATPTTISMCSREIQKALPDYDLCVPLGI